MPYVRRDQSGRIVALSETAMPDTGELVAQDSTEITEFLKSMGGATTDSRQDARLALIESDLTMVRVVEDLIDILIERNIIMLTDLPGAAQTKLMARRSLRGRLSGLVGLVDEQQGDL